MTEPGIFAPGAKVSRDTNTGTNDGRFLRLVVLALILIAIGVMIGRIFRSIAKHSYHRPVVEVNLNLA
jgi:hypothetical protein